MINRILQISLIAIISMVFFASYAKADSISFYTIRENMNKMTDLQFKKYTNSLERKRVTWIGWVENVKEKFFGGYECWIDMDSPKEAFSVQDVTFEVSKSIASQLEKDARYKFSGTIKSVMKILGSLQVTLVDVQFK